MTHRWIGAASAALLFFALPTAASAQTIPDDQVPPAPTCRPEDNPETGVQGRIPPEYHDDGEDNVITCNTSLVGHFGTSGGYKVERYIDALGNECAFYDTTLLIGANVVNDNNDPPGTFSLDLRDPANPTFAATMPTPAFSSPHESVLLNQERGLIAAVLGNPVFFPGAVDLYDVSENCLDPQFQASAPVGVLGHESGFSPDGNTYWVASLHSPTIVAIDVTNPRTPTPLWVGEYYSHGLGVSPDGNRLYVATGRGNTVKPGEDGMRILDVSQIQARTPDPEVTEVSFLTWDNVGTPQINLPVTFDGVPHLVEMDEFGGPAKVGAARIINIADETAPFVVSQMRLAVNQESQQVAFADDPGAGGLQGYRGHYCSVPTTVDPQIVACTFILSGLRIFDISDIDNPHEVAYFNVVPEGDTPYAMSSVAFDPDDGHLWYSDGNSGFYVVDLDDSIYPPLKVAGDQAIAPLVPVAPDAPSEPAPAGPAVAPSSAPGLPATGTTMPLLFLLGALTVGVVLRRRAAHR